MRDSMASSSRLAECMLLFPFTYTKLSLVKISGLISQQCHVCIHLLFFVPALQFFIVESQDGFITRVTGKYPYRFAPINSAVIAPIVIFPCNVS
jgi:hypothetical protein